MLEPFNEASELNQLKRAILVIEGLCLVDDRLNNIDAEGFEISSQIYGIVHGLNKHCKKTCPVAVEGLNSIEKL